MARAQYNIDPQRLTKIWKLRGYYSLKDVFRDKSGDENAYMRYDSAQKKINSGVVSKTIMDFLCDRLDCPAEYLSGDMSENFVNDWGLPNNTFTKRLAFVNMTKEEKEAYRESFLFDLGIYDAWMEMDNRERAHCHTAIREFSNWLLDYMKPSENDYLAMYDFFKQTGLHMQATPELRQELFRTLALTYKVFMETHKQ